MGLNQEEEWRMASAPSGHWTTSLSTRGSSPSSSSSPGPGWCHLCIIPWKRGVNLPLCYWDQKRKHWRGEGTLNSLSRWGDLGWHGSALWNPLGFEGYAGHSESEVPEGDPRLPADVAGGCPSLEKHKSLTLCLSSWVVWFLLVASLFICVVSEGPQNFDMVLKHQIMRIT